MPNQKEYRIVINGISESIGAIDSLIKKINTLEEKITALNKNGVTVNVQQTGTVNTGSQAQQAQQVAEVQRQITIEIDRQNEELRQQASFIDASKTASNDVLQIANAVLGTYGENIAKLDELNQQLAANKKAQKDVADALKSEAIDAQTAAESRQRLLDEELRIKQARSEVSTILKNEVKMTQAQEASYDQMSQTLGRLRDALRASGSGLSPEQFEAVSRAIDKMDKELKEADKSVGNFQRNVGNYASAADGFGKITVTIAGVSREFESARSAIMELRNAMAQLVASGQQGTEAYKALEEQMKNLQLAMITVNDSIDKAKDASAGLHDAVEAIQGIAAIGSIGQGLASLFGIDDSALGEQIKKLTSLMAIMQGLQQLSTQMATGTGIGPALKKVLDVSGINNNFANLKDNLMEIGNRLGLVKTQAETASAGMGNFSLAMRTAGNAAAAFGKTLAAALATTGIIWAIGEVIDALRRLGQEIYNIVSVNDDYKRSNEALKATIDNLNQAMEHQLDNIDNSVLTKQISEAEGYAQKMDVIKTKIQEYANIYSQVGSLVEKGSIFGSKFIKPALQDWSELEKEIAGVQNRLASGADIRFDTTLGKALGDIIKQWELLDKTDEQAMSNWAKRVKEGANYQWVLTNAMKSTNDEVKNVAIQIDTMVNGIYNAAVAGDRLRNNLAAAAAQVRAEVAAIDKYGRNWHAGLNMETNISQLDQMRQAGQLTDGEYAKRRAEYEREYQKSVESTNKALYSANKKRLNEAKKTANDLVSIEKQIQADKIAAMRDGLTKTLATIEEERRARLDAIKKYPAAKQEEARAAANARYDKAVLDAQKEFHDKREKEEREFNLRFLRETAEYEQKMTDAIANENEKSMDAVRKRLSQYTKMVSLPTIFESRDIPQDIKELYETTLEMMTGFSDYENRLDTKLKQSIESYNEIINNASGRDFNEDEKSKLVEYIEDIRLTRSEMDKLEEQRMSFVKFNKAYPLVDEKFFNFDDANVRDSISEFYRTIASYSEDGIAVYYNQSKQAIEDKMKADRKEIEEAAKAELAEFDKLWEDRMQDEKFIETEFGGDENKALQERNNRRLEIENLWRLRDQSAYQEYLSERNRLDNEYTKDSIKVYEGFYSQLSRLYTDANSSIMNKVSRLPDAMKNAWGTFNLGDYKSKLNDAAKNMDGLRDHVRLSLEGIREDWLNGFIDDDTFYALERDMTRTRDMVTDNLNDIKDKMSSANGDWWKGIDEWIQQVSQSFQQVLSAIFDYQNGEFDRMQEAIDKELELVQKKYDEMEELAQKHKDAMNEIEDELSTARGDRRSHLIDALSAEIQAQRDALAAQRKAEKEKEALEKKSDKLELQRKKQQRKQDIIQAILNGALAISQAATNRWPIPAVPLMALAAAATAAQVAIMSKTHYAKGGLLEGKSHAQGGIPVGNTGIEVEGNEFVTNKKTTMKNLDLLYYINSKKRKLDISDFIEFYTKNEKTRKPIISNRFADGGLTPNIDLAERLVNIVVERDNREIVVSVVDIARAQDRLANVRELAGD